MTGQYLAAPGVVLLAVSASPSVTAWSFNYLIWDVSDPSLAAGEHPPTTPGDLFTWFGAGPTGNLLQPPSYTLSLTGAAFAMPPTPPQPEVAWGGVAGAPIVGSTLSLSNFTATQFFWPLDSFVSQTSTPTGLGMHVQQDAFGRFQVLMTGIAPPATGVLHVTSLSQHTAVIRQWYSWHDPTNASSSSGPTTLRTVVELFDPSGLPAFGAFNVHYRNGGDPSEHAAYLFADQPTSASYTPSPTYSWNGNRPDPTITRSATGVYQATLPGLGLYASSERGHVQVSPYNPMLLPSKLVRAKVAGWSASGADIVVNLRTFGVGGVPMDAMFTLSYHERAAPVPEHRGSGAHVWANDPFSSSYTPLAPYTDSNGNAGPANAEVVSRTGTGSYVVDLPDLSSYTPYGSGLGGSIGMVTAYGTGSAYASMDNFVTNAVGGSQVLVNTYDTNGTPANSRFDLLFLSGVPAGAAASNAVIGGSCGGPVLWPSERPLLGTQWPLEMTGVPTGSLLGLVVVGVSNPHMSLGQVGAPGCTLYSDATTIATTPLPANSPAYSVSIPNSSTLLSVEVFLQGVVLLPGANALGLALGNGVRGRLGDV